MDIYPTVSSSISQSDEQFCILLYVFFGLGRISQIIEMSISGADWFRHYTAIFS